MAMIFHPDADIAKGEPTITYDEFIENETGQLIPVVAATNEEPRQLGSYAAMHLKYIKEEKPKQYAELMLLGNMTEYLNNIEQQAQKRKDTIIEQQKKALGVTEELKANDQMQWVGMMNNITHSAEEIVLSEIIYADTDNE